MDSRGPGQRRLGGTASGAMDWVLQTLKPSKPQNPRAWSSIYSMYGVMCTSCSIYSGAGSPTKECSWHPSRFCCLCRVVVAVLACRELALESGVEKWGRVPALNTNARFIEDLADAVVSSRDI